MNQNDIESKALEFSREYRSRLYKIREIEAKIFCSTTSFQWEKLIEIGEVKLSENIYKIDIDTFHEDFDEKYHDPETAKIEEYFLSIVKAEDIYLNFWGSMSGIVRMIKADRN